MQFVFSNIFHEKLEQQVIVWLADFSRLASSDSAFSCLVFCLQWLLMYSFTCFKVGFSRTMPWPSGCSQHWGCAPWHLEALLLTMARYRAVLSLAEEFKKTDVKWECNTLNLSLLLGLGLTQTLQSIQWRHGNHRLAFMGSGFYNSPYILSYLVEFFP